MLRTLRVYDPDLPASNRDWHYNKEGIQDTWIHAQMPFVERKPFESSIEEIIAILCSEEFFMLFPDSPSIDQLKPKTRDKKGLPLVNWITKEAVFASREEGGADALFRTLHKSYEFAMICGFSRKSSDDVHQLIGDGLKTRTEEHKLETLLEFSLGINDDRLEWFLTIMDRKYFNQFRTLLATFKT